MQPLQGLLKWPEGWGQGDFRQLLPREGCPGSSPTSAPGFELLTKSEQGTPCVVPPPFPQLVDHPPEPEHPDSRPSSLPHPFHDHASVFSLCKMGLIMPALAASEGGCITGSRPCSPNCVALGSLHVAPLDLSFRIFGMVTKQCLAHGVPLRTKQTDARVHLHASLQPNGTHTRST